MCCLHASFNYISNKTAGLTFTQTVKTSNVITALLEADGLIAPGLKTDLEGSLTDVGCVPLVHFLFVILMPIAIQSQDSQGWR